jgi:hypothetical protein
MVEAWLPPPKEHEVAAPRSGEKHIRRHALFDGRTNGNVHKLPLDHEHPSYFGTYDAPSLRKNFPRIALVEDIRENDEICPPVGKLRSLLDDEIASDNINVREVLDSCALGDFLESRCPNINSDNAPRRTNKLRGGNNVKAGTAPKVHDMHPFTDTGLPEHGVGADEIP